MNLSDLKMGLLNASALAVSMTQIDNVLKITLLIVSIGYTLSKWHGVIKNKKNKKK
jgi:hypothetical protein|tara:strand:- start:188 stop:355 length:168 start_codon:yes stop_codon:yes gene_type:complete